MYCICASKSILYYVIDALKTKTKNMYVSCRGDHTSPPDGIQGTVERLAISSNSTCAIVKSNQVVCWGALSIPSVTCDSLYMYSTTALCLVGTTLTDLVTHDSYTSVTSVTTSPLNACFKSNSVPVCLAAPPPLSNGSVYATDDGACVVGTTTSCSGSVVFLPRAQKHLYMTTSGHVVCNKWDDGWECSRDGADVPLWPFVTDTYHYPVDIDTVAFFASNTSLHMCVVDDDDISCNMYQIRKHDTYLGANVKDAAVSASHECILYKIESSFLVWLFILLISALLLIVIFLGIYQRTH